MVRNNSQRKTGEQAPFWVCRVIVHLFIAGLILSAGVCRADGDQSADSLPGTYRFLGEDGIIRFPFEIFNGDIRFQCEVNGRPVYMLLDDGFMWDQLLFWGSPEVDSLDFVYDGEIEVGGDNNENEGGKLASKTASGITVRLPGVEFIDQTAVITPYSSGNAGMWWGSAGQISATFFKHFVVDINFDQMVITLIKPDDFEYQGRGVAVPWQPLGFGPWSIPATLHLEDGRSIAMKLLMDLGYNDQLQVAVAGEHEITLPAKKLEASLGFNIQGQETRGFTGRLPQLDIGEYHVKDLLMSYVSEEYNDHVVYEAMIGLGLLSRFNLVFDYHQQRLFVEPNNKFNDPFEQSMTGFSMVPTPKGYGEILRIEAGSPAEEAGLKAGDRVLQINGKPVADYDISGLRSMFKCKGVVINLLIEREGEEKKVSLTLRRVI